MYVSLFIQLLETEVARSRMAGMLVLQLTGTVAWLWSRLVRLVCMLVRLM